MPATRQHRFSTPLPAGVVTPRHPCMSGAETVRLGAVVRAAGAGHSQPGDPRPQEDRLPERRHLLHLDLRPVRGGFVEGNVCPCGSEGGGGG